MYVPPPPPIAFRTKGDVSGSFCDLPKVWIATFIPLRWKPCVCMSGTSCQCVFSRRMKAAWAGRVQSISKCFRTHWKRWLLFCSRWGTISSRVLLVSRSGPNGCSHLSPTLFDSSVQHLQTQDSRFHPEQFLPACRRPWRQHRFELRLSTWHQI